MQATQNRPLPRAVDDRRRGSAHYYSDVYDQVEQQAQRSPTREIPVSQPTQHQQRMAPVEQGRPPVANNASVRRGGAEGTSRPSSYLDQAAPHEDLLSKTQEAIKHSQQQQSRRRGYRRTDESGDEPTAAASNLPFDSRAEIESSKPVPTSPQKQLVPNTRNRADAMPPQRSSEPQRGLPRRADSAQTAGNAIPRLNSPSVVTSVLQPLNGKIQEYGTQMNDAQDLMDQLDAEMAVLQERRREAEQRFMAAKTKHDDYRRQYQGVERALKGEPDISFSRLSVDSERPSTQQTVQHQQIQQQDEGMRSRTESWNSMNSASKRESGTGRFRISKLFG